MEKKEINKKKKSKDKRQHNRKRYPDGGFSKNPKQPPPTMKIPKRGNPKEKLRKPVAIPGRRTHNTTSESLPHGRDHGTTQRDAKSKRDFARDQRGGRTATEG